MFKNAHRILFPVSGSLYAIPYILYDVPCYVVYMHNTLITTTILFWGYSGAKNGTIIHKIDAYVARITFLHWVVYGLCYTNRDKFVMIFLILMFLNFACIGDYYSRQKWLCSLHICNHLGVHLTGLIYIIYCLCKF